MEKPESADNELGQKGIGGKDVTGNRSMTSERELFQTVYEAVEARLFSPTSAGRMDAWSDSGMAEHAFTALFAKLIKSGPGARSERHGPARLLELVQEAAARGSVSISLPTDMRRSLSLLEEELERGGFWDMEHAPWWRPLPEPDRVEKIWSALEESIRLPAREQLVQAFDAPGGPRWAHVPAIIDDAFLGDLVKELEQALAGGLLGLERGGVGSSGEVIAARSDWVRYVAGCEPDLLAATPLLAGMVQWGLARLGPWLQTVFPENTLIPPQSAMLAYYPAPSAGYHCHIDNPAGERDNGRALTLIFYLSAARSGGELALWGPGGPVDHAPDAMVTAAGGSAILFDARTIAHRVQPIGAGQGRWALTFWLQDPRPLPISVSGFSWKPEVGDALLALERPPLPSNSVLFHVLDQDSVSGSFSVVKRSGVTPRTGIVSTVYRGGARLGAWCAHHFDLGFDQIFLVFDHLEEPRERADAERLAARFPRSRLTILSGGELMKTGWPGVARDNENKPLFEIAGKGSSSSSICARQCLNASAVLRAAQSGEYGDGPLDWLVHLDSDELFILAGVARGGAGLHAHFDAAQSKNWPLIRYVNHELLPTRTPNARPRFKLNPRLAAARLGKTGWRALTRCLSMSQADRTPYFNGYFNGKSAVRVAVADSAAGVHGWRLQSGVAQRERFVAGPFIYHFHFSNAESFCAKYRAMADAPQIDRLFEPSPTEAAALALIRELEGRDVASDEIDRRLIDLYQAMTFFSDDAIDVLEEAGLILEPELNYDLTDPRW